MAGHVAPLDQSVAVGRHVGTHGLSIDDPFLSRSHFTVQWDDERKRHVVRDAGSRNGTRRNGERVELECLNEGDVLRAGDTIVRFASVDVRHVGWVSPTHSMLRGSSRALRSTLERIQQVARTNLPVLVLGATGTGKELVACEVHARSGRTGRFVTVNCAAIPAALFESELFGHVRGAFTNAVETRTGWFREAQGGTLFLDELGEMPVQLQAKLLRAVEAGEVTPVGSHRAERIDVRVVAATNRDLDEAVRVREFREDLYARLNGWRIQLAPLCERPEDILPIVVHTIDAEGPLSPQVNADAFEAMALYSWPGNVRELVGVVKAALVAAPGSDYIGINHLPEPLQPRPETAVVAPALPPRGTVPTREELVVLMRTVKGNVALAARTAGTSRMQVYRWLERNGVESADFRE